MTTTATVKLRSDRPNLIRPFIDEIMYSNFIYEYDDKKNIVKVYIDRNNEKACKLFGSIVWFYESVIEDIQYYTDSEIHSDLKNQKRLDEWM